VAFSIAVAVTLDQAVEGFRVETGKRMGIDLRLDTLTFTYPSGVRAVQGVSMAIQAGEAVAIIGQNGAGKTTLVKHFNSLLQPTSGSVWVGDWDTRDKSAAQLARRVGYVFQNPDDQLFQSSVRAEVMFGPKNLGFAEDQIETRTQEALRTVDLVWATDRHPYDLSPGERKRVRWQPSWRWIHQPWCWMSQPRPRSCRGILVGEIVRDKSQGKTVITITHDIDFCAEHFESVVVMAAGKILLVGESRSVLEQADLLAHSYVEPPQLVRLAKRLDMGFVPLNVEEFIEAWLKSSDR
jgi:energy-coupling factor transport system ATP-binding protein